MPLTTTSGRRGQNSKMPSFTLSAGLPSTAQPRGRSPASNTCLATSGCKNVIEWPTPLCSVAGATTTTSPSSPQLRLQSREAGSVNAVVVGEEDQHNRFLAGTKTGPGGQRDVDSQFSGSKFAPG